MTSFSEHCKSVVKEYIQTVMIIDDGAGLDNQEIIAGDLVIPPSNDPFSTSEVEEIPIETTNTAHITHSLDTFSLTNAFFEEGIVAGIYQPKIENDQSPKMFALKAISVCEKADIIILDWILKGRNSEYSKEIVKEILHDDHMNGGRVRAIVIYTGESNLNNLRDELFSYLNNDELEKSDNYEIRSRNIIISFYNKNHDGYDFAPDRTIAEAEIPREALNCFSILVNGLVPVFAMKSAASIRKNTGRIISRFGKNLDTAYLAHRVLLPEPEDSEVFMLENFVSYMRNILAISRVDNFSLGAESIDGWIRDNNERLERKIIHGNEEYEIELDDIIELSQMGFSKKLYSILEKKKEIISKAFKDTSKLPSLKAISMFDCNEIKVIDSSVELSILSSFRRTFKDIIGSNETPYLTQGSLIYSKIKDQFLLCVTPKCDTARIEKELKFSFVILSEVSGTSFDIVIPENSCISKNKSHMLAIEEERINYQIIENCLSNDGKCIDNELYNRLKTIRNYKNEKYIYLRTLSKFHRLEHIIFESDDKKRVLSNNTQDNLTEFWDADCNEYVWIGDLHDLNTIYRVGNLISNLNRTGIDEVEWLRRQYQ